jgi:hypothetical protein
LNLDDSVKPEGILAYMFLLETREPYTFASSRPESSECLVQIPKRLLRGTLGYPIHPREIRWFYGVEGLMLLNSIGEFLFTLLGIEAFDSSSKRPIPSEACSACVLG